MCFPCVLTRHMYVSSVHVCAVFNFLVTSQFSIHYIPGILKKRYLCGMKGKVSPHSCSAPSSKLAWEGVKRLCCQRLTILGKDVLPESQCEMTVRNELWIPFFTWDFFDCVSHSNSINRCTKRVRTALSGKNIALKFKGAWFVYSDCHLLAIWPWIRVSATLNLFYHLSNSLEDCHEN